MAAIAVPARRGVPHVEEERLAELGGRAPEGRQQIDHHHAGARAEGAELILQGVEGAPASSCVCVGKDHHARAHRRARGYRAPCARRGRSSQAISTLDGILVRRQRRHQLLASPVPARARPDASRRAARPHRTSIRTGPRMACGAYAGARLREGRVGDVAQREHGRGVEVLGRVVEVVDAELHQDQVRLVPESDAAQQLGLGVRVVAAHAEVQDLVRRPAARAPAGGSRAASRRSPRARRRSRTTPSRRSPRGGTSPPAWRARTTRSRKPSALVAYTTCRPARHAGSRSAPARRAREIRASRGADRAAPARRRRHDEAQRRSRAARRHDEAITAAASRGSAPAGAPRGPLYDRRAWQRVPDAGRRRGRARRALCRAKSLG